MKKKNIKVGLGKKIVKKLIKKSFPKLKGKLIFVTETKIMNFKYSAVTNYFMLFSWIAIHPDSRGYSKNALIGLLCHELSHLDILANMNFYQKLKFAFSFLFTKKAKLKFESDADKLAIDKGYVRELIKFKEESQKKYLKKNKGYLSIKEIKSYMKNHK